MSVIMDGKSSDPMENLKKKPAKGILKSSSSFEVPDGPSGSTRRASKSKESNRAKWDEMNILATLHPPDKDYGHMVIDEPKTPYEKPYTEAEDESVDPNILAEKIVERCKNPSTSSRPRSSSVSSTDSDEELTPEERERKREFEKRRRDHYNEFLMAKKAMKDLQDEEEDEDEK